jgi:hypothetical protein
MGFNYSEEELNELLREMSGMALMLNQLVQF